MCQFSNWVMADYLIQPRWYIKRYYCIIWSCWYHPKHKYSASGQFQENDKSSVEKQSASCHLEEIDKSSVLSHLYWMICFQCEQMMAPHDDDGLPVLRPLEQYWSHIGLEGDNEGLFAMKSSLDLDIISLKTPMEVTLKTVETNRSISASDKKG